MLMVNGAALSLKNLMIWIMRSWMSGWKSPVDGRFVELWYTSALNGTVTLTWLPRPAFIRAA